MSREAALKAWDTRGRTGRRRAYASHTAGRKAWGLKPRSRRKGIATGSLRRYNEMNYLFNRGFLARRHFKAYSRSQTGRADLRFARRAEGGRLTWYRGRQIN